MIKQKYGEKLERGLAQVRAGQGIVKTMEESESMAEETRIAQLQLLLPNGKVGSTIAVFFGCRRKRRREKRL